MTTQAPRQRGPCNRHPATLHCNVATADVSCLYTGLYCRKNKKTILLVFIEHNHQPNILCTPIGGKIVEIESVNRLGC